MLFFGYLFTLAIGVSLRIFGSGGSLLALPIFMYFFSIPPFEAATYSLSVVFTGAVFSFFITRKKTSMALTKLSTFALPAVVMVIITKMYLIPLLPEKIVLSTFEISQAQYMATLFGCVGIFASYTLLQKKEKGAVIPKPSEKLLGLYGGITGTLTALFGSGGGFIIVPALRQYAGMNLQEAVPTSLIIVMLTSFIGLSSSLFAGTTINLSLLIITSILVLLGTGIGSIWSMYLKETNKEKILGYLILTVSSIAVFIQYI